MNRKESQALAAVRLREARILLKAECWDGAYHLAGYSIECALKACIARRTRRHDFPPDKEYVGKSYSHKLNGLLTHAQLEGPFKAEATPGSTLAANWQTVISWDSESRYQRISETKAREFLIAVGGRQHGVLLWIRKRW